MWDDVLSEIVSAGSRRSDDSEDEESRRLLVWLFTLVVLLVTGWWSASELRYLVWGRVIEAKLIQSHAVPGQIEPEERVLRVTYEFREPGGSLRREEDDVPEDWILSPLSPIDVQYIPGSPGSSRLAGNFSLVPVFVFAGVLAWLGFCLYKVWREARAAVAGRRSRPLRRLRP